VESALECLYSREASLCRNQDGLGFKDDRTKDLQTLGTEGRSRGHYVCHRISHPEGTRGLDAAAFFAGHGFTDVRALRGGIDAWSLEVDPSLPRYTIE
jgi:hypothetical protein